MSLRHQAIKSFPQFLFLFEKNCKLTFNKKSEYFNFVAIEILEQMGNDSPTQQQIDFVETLLSKCCKKHKFNKKNPSLLQN